MKEKQEKKSVDNVGYWITAALRFLSHICWDQPEYFSAFSALIYERVFFGKWCRAAGCDFP